MADDREFDGFALFYQADRRNPKSPEFKGRGTIDRATLDYIVSEVRAGRNPKLEIAGWTRQGRRGKFQSLVVSIPYDVRQERRDDRDDRWRDDDRRRDDRGRDDRGRDDDRAPSWGRRSMSDEDDRRRDDRRRDDPPPRRDDRGRDDRPWDEQGPQDDIPF